MVGLPASHVVRQHAARDQRFVHGNAALRIPALATFDHGILNILQRRISHFVFDVDSRSLHFGKAHACAHQVSVALCFQEGGSLFHPRFELHPIGHPVVENLGETRVVRVCLMNGHDVRRLERVRHLFNLGALGVSQLDPAELGRRISRVNRKAVTQFGNIQSTGGQVFFLICHKHEQTTVGGIVAHQSGAVVWHDLNQLVREATHAIVLDRRTRAIWVNNDFRHVTVMVRIRHRFVTKQVFAEGFEHLVVVGKKRVWLVFFAGQMRVPR